MNSLSYALFLALLDNPFTSALNGGKLECGFFVCEVFILGSYCMKDLKKSLSYFFFFITANLDVARKRS